MSSSDCSNPNLIARPIEEHAEAGSDLGSSKSNPDEAKATKADETCLPEPRQRKKGPIISRLLRTLVSLESIELTIKDGARVPSRELKELTIKDGAGIQSMELAIKDGASESSHQVVYGKIMVSGRYGKVYALYNRNIEEAETIPKGEPYKLRLPGPIRSLESPETQIIHVRLHEIGPDEALLFDDIFFNQYYWNYVHKPIVMPLEGSRASLQVSFCRFSGSVPLEVSISPIRQGAESPWKVYGTVRVLQHAVSIIPENPCFKSSFILFDRSAQETVEAFSGKPITLDRNVIVAPVQREVTGPFITIDVDLLFVGNENGNKTPLKCQKDFIFKVKDPLSRYPILDTIPINNGNGAPDSLEIKLDMVLDYWTSFSDDEDEDGYEEILSQIEGFQTSSMLNP